MKGFLKLEHDFFYELCKQFTPVETIIIVYLRGKQRYFRRKTIYLTDDQIKKDIGLSRITMTRFRRKFKHNPFIQIKIGKFRKSASEYTLNEVDEKGHLIDTLLNTLYNHF